MTALLLLLALVAQPEHVVSRLFATTSDGPFVSYSWGEHWVRLRPDLRGFAGEITTIVCLGPAVYAGGAEGIFVSDDYGENYVRLASFPGKGVTTFHTARLFELEPTLLVGTTSGLHRSTDGGRKWTRIGETLITATVRDTVWPGPQLYAATDGGLFVSEDVGDSWKALDAGLPEAPLLSIVVSQYFLADPKILVGSRGAGLYRSEDGGASFERVGDTAMASKTVEALYWWNSLLLIGTNDGLFMSDDAGDTLREAEELDGHRILSILVPAAEGYRSDILVGTDKGVFKSADGGVSFRLLTEGLGAPRVNELSTFPAPPQDRERSR
jgi:photosystem II stability/assembly factor-like uncharacterized protein